MGATHIQLQLTVPAVLRDLFKEINPKTHGFFFSLVRPIVTSSVSAKPSALHLAGNGPFLQVLSGFLWTAGIYCRNLAAVTALGHQTPHALRQHRDLL